MGIVKKTGYLAVVAVAICVDWILQSIFHSAGIDIGVTYAVGIIVVIWLIINELISILENIAFIGVPVPKFLTKIISRLKAAAESHGNGTNGDNPSPKQTRSALKEPEKED